MKEVGIKKVLGSARKNLIFQFLAESMLLTIISLVIALGLAWILLSPFNTLTGEHINLDFSPPLFLALIGITLFTGLISGSYPALYLSGFKPIALFRGKGKSSFAELAGRQGLVVFQFALTVILIISVLVVYRQMKFIQSTNLGYNKDHLIRFASEGTIQHTEYTFIDELKKVPGVVNASYTFNAMVGRNFGNYGIDWPGKSTDESVYFEGFGVGYDFIEIMDMKMAAGRSFSRNYGLNSTRIIVNQAAVRAMNLKHPVGQTIKLFGQPRQIIGVVRDFHFESLHVPVKPVYMTLDPPGNPWDKIMVRIKAGQEKGTIAGIQKCYETYNPGFPFEFHFLDQAYQKQYMTEMRVEILSRYFAALAILISCLGLFGLATFTAQRRQKEFGIRKIAGATPKDIAAMLSADFLKLVGLAILVAFPVSWWVMHQWLQTFAYRIHLGIQVFLISAVSVLFITLVTISYQAIQAALVNPVKSLRSQ